jgi:sugar lactone lactonase YvrE
VAALPIDESCRANEGACSPAGLLSVGSMAYAETANAGNVWSYRADGSLDVALPGTTISNGTVFTGEDSVLFADSATGQICRYAVAGDGAWSDREVLVTIDEPGVGPDGICMDADGGIWVALWDGSRAQRWSADGTLTHQVMLPTPRATSVALGGADGRTLFVTTSAVDLPDDVVAGACFTARVETPGQPVRPCRVPARP